MPTSSRQNTIDEPSGNDQAAYVEGLWKKIDILQKNNETMRMKLHEAQARIAELESLLP